MSDLNEAQTRRQLIDPQLKGTGWDLNDPVQVRFEIPVDCFDPTAWQARREELLRTGESRVAYETDLPSGICDYALYRRDGDILAIVAAKYKLCILEETAALTLASLLSVHSPGLPVSDCAPILLENPRPCDISTLSGRFCTENGRCTSRSRDFAALCWAVCDFSNSISRKQVTRPTIQPVLGPKSSCDCVSALSYATLDVTVAYGNVVRRNQKDYCSRP